VRRSRRIGVEPEHAAAEGDPDAGDLAADEAQPDDAERAAVTALQTHTAPR